MKNSFPRKISKSKINIDYKYGKLYAINLMIDKEEKDLYNLKTSEKSNINNKKHIEIKESELKKSKSARDNTFKEISNLYNQNNIF